MLQPAAIGRQQLIGAPNDHRNLSAVVAPERAEIGEIAGVTADEADRAERLMRQAPHGCRYPLCQALAAALDVQSVAEVIGENDIEAGEQLILDIPLDRDQSSGHWQAIMYIAVEDELAGGAALERDVQL